MVINQKVTGKAIPIAAGLALGAGASVLISLLAVSILSYMILTEKISPESIGYCAMVTLWLASAGGSWLAAATVKHRWLPICLGVGGIYYGLLAGITVMFFGGQFQGMFVTALMILAGSGSVALLGLRSQLGGKKNIRKIRFR
jgi:hypothetical protein